MSTLRRAGWLVGRTWISVPFGVVALSSSAGMVAITSSDEWNLSFSFSFSCTSTIIITITINNKSE